MPQPLSSKHVTSIIYGDIVSARPQHAALALQIIILAARAELSVGKVLVCLSPDNGDRLAEHYNSQENDAKRGATVEAITSVLLTSERQDQLRRILAEHRSAQKQRTPFAHWLYAFSEEAPDFLILVDPRKELLAEAAEGYLRHHWIESAHSPNVQTERQEMLQKANGTSATAVATAQAYDVAELEKIRAKLERVDVCLDLFQRMVLWKGAQEANDSQSASLEEILRNLDSPFPQVWRGVQTRRPRQWPQSYPF